MRKKNMSAETQKHIIKNIDNLDKNDKQELLTLIKRYNTSCIKSNGDGTYINLDRLSPELLCKIKAFVDNRIQYYQFFDGDL